MPKSLALDKRCYQQGISNEYPQHVFSWRNKKNVNASRLCLIWPRGYKTFFMLNSAEHNIFSAYSCKYENANNYSWHFHIYQQRNFHAPLCLARKNLQLLVI